MPLNKQKLIADIIIAQEKAQKAKFNIDGRKIFARELAMAIDLFIKSGDVQTTTTGIGIVAPGIATAGSSYAHVTVSPGQSTTTGTGVGKVV
jgi:hypothetical protein|tara:strand:+ start:10 stop:285 length:276 start_codon:yes stop_codon:yes gene_type:complete